jgi:RNA polymerase sigma-70 factor, ECF subfamily
MPTSQDSLVQRLRQRDPAAFDTLVEMHATRIYDTLCWLCGDRQLAEDLAQETFLAAWRGIDGFRGEAEMLTWLHRIARNVVLQHARKHQVDTVPFDDTTETTSGEGVATDAARAILQDSVREALAELPTEQREALVLNKLSGFSHGEIAHILDRPLGTVKWQIAQGLDALRGILRAKGVTDNAL